MAAQRASAPVRLARRAAVGLIVVLALIIAVRLIGRRSAAPVPGKVEPPPDGRVVDLKERVRQQEYKDGRPVVDIRGKSFSRGPDGRNHLAGAIEVLSLGSDGAVRSRLTADEVSYDPGSLRYTVAGHVRVEAGDLVLEGDSFDYDKNAGLFGTTAGGRFASKKLRGRAQELLYRESADEIRLDRGFRVELTAAERGGSLTVSGQSFSYSRRDRRGRIDGQAAIQGSDFESASDSASFLAIEDESALASADLEGSARIVLRGKEPSGEGSGEIRADRIALGFSREPSALAVRTSASTSLTLRSSPDRTETVLAQAMLLNVLRADGRCTWIASGGLRAEIAEAGAVRRRLEGEAGTFDGAKILAVSGGPGRPAVADSDEARIEAARIDVATASGEVLAEGGVASVLKGGDRRRPVGFFPPGEDVAVSSERLNVRPESSTSLFSGRVVARQGKNEIRAREIETAGEMGLMTGRGGVVVTLTEPPSAGKAGRPIEFGGADLAYRPDLRTLTLSSKASVKLPDVLLEASTVTAVIGGDGRTLESLAAAKSVTCSHGRYVGRSEAATYEAATGRVTLTGKPVLTDDKGGSARGAKLTFSLTDDKIFIENEGPGRATTVVRS